MLENIITSRESNINFLSKTMYLLYDIVYLNYIVNSDKCAPTGTVSLMARCSSGLEPIFMPYYQRKRKCISPGDRVDYTDIKGEKYTLFVVVHPGLMQWASMKYGKTEKELQDSWTTKEWEKAFKESPYYGSTAPEINWHQRVKLQGIIQKYITHSISSTVNLDNKTTEEEIANIYIEAWKEGLKGITINL